MLSGFWTHSPARPSPWARGQTWGGELGGRSTGAKALLCFTAEIMLTGEKEKTLVVGAAAGRDIEEAAASGGLEGMTPGRGGQGQSQQGGRWETQQGDSTRVSNWGAAPTSRHQAQISPGALSVLDRMWRQAGFFRPAFAF